MKRTYTQEQKERYAAYKKAWYQANRERLLEKAKARQQANREQCAAYKKTWYQLNREERMAYRKRYYHANSARGYAAVKAWRLANPEQKRAAARSWEIQKLETDLNYRIRRHCGKIIQTAVRLRAGKKAFKTMQLLGCDIPWLRAWLEVQFKPEMSWENQGQWEIDHKRPCSSFDLTDPIQQKLCFHWTNLQPLWAAENRTKAAKWESELVA